MAEHNGAHNGAQIMTADKAKLMLDNITVEDPSKWPAGVQTLIVGLYARVDELHRVIVQVGRAAHILAGEVRALRAGAATEVPAADSSVEVPAPADDDVPTVSAGGEPLSGEEIAREAAMNAAIAAAEAEKNGGAPPARQMVVRGRNGQRRRPPAPPVVAGGDPTANLPDDPVERQAALNAIMDAASTETT